MKLELNCSNFCLSMVFFDKNGFHSLISQSIHRMFATCDYFLLNQILFSILITLIWIELRLYQHSVSWYLYLLKIQRKTQISQLRHYFLIIKRYLKYKIPCKRQSISCNAWSTCKIHSFTIFVGFLDTDHG